MKRKLKPCFFTPLLADCMAMVVTETTPSSHCGTALTMKRILFIFALGLFAMTAFAAETPEDVFWKSVRKANVLDEYEIYVKQYPNGRYVADAQAQVKSLKEIDAARELDRLQPDWRIISKSSEFNEWKQSLSESERSELESTWNPRFISERIDKFKNRKQADELAVEIGKVIDVNEQYGFLVASVTRQVKVNSRVYIDMNGKRLLGRAEKQSGSRLSITLTADFVTMQARGKPVFMFH